MARSRSRSKTLPRARRGAARELRARIAELRARRAGTLPVREAVEAIEKAGGALAGKPAAKLSEGTTKIYEACGFQDITGQPIAKVVKALKEIEHRVDAMVAAFGEEIGARPAKAAAPVKTKDGEGQKHVTDEDLLNGPQLKSAAKTQAEIDALLLGP